MGTRGIIFQSFQQKSAFFQFTKNSPKEKNPIFAIYQTIQYDENNVRKRPIWKMIKIAKLFIVES